MSIFSSLWRIVFTQNILLSYLSIAAAIRKDAEYKCFMVKLKLYISLWISTGTCVLKALNREGQIQPKIVFFCVLKKINNSSETRKLYSTKKLFCWFFCENSFSAHIHKPKERFYAFLKVFAMYIDNSMKNGEVPQSLQWYILR